MIEESAGGGGHSAFPSIVLDQISKSFGPVRANKNISLSIESGSIHGIVGENGAGKSTLMSILYGFYQADFGKIKINGKHVSIRNSDDAIAAGIGMVHQHFMLVPPFTVLENVILGAERSWMLRETETSARIKIDSIAKEYGLEIDVDAPVSTLSVGHQQRVEILKALYRDAEILILDEPTGVLTPSEAHHLFNILRDLKGRGKTVILITHKLREIVDFTDTVSVMRQGTMSVKYKTSSLTVEQLAKKMVGRSIGNTTLDKRTGFVGAEVLKVDSIRLFENGVAKLKNIAFELNAGEILGVAGVAGNGQSKLLDVLSGISAATSGSVLLNGECLNITKNGQATQRRQSGIGHVPEDRHARGLILPFSLWENASFGYHRRPEFTHGFFSKPESMIERSSDLIERFDIRPQDPHLRVANLSGGNQQKLIIARETTQEPDVLLVGQPTRGVDIGAIENIYSELIKLRDMGKAILLVSVELDEILKLSDRVIVMFDGAISGVRNVQDTDENDLGLLMAGIDNRKILQ